MTIVSIVKGDNPQEITIKALQMVKALDKISVDKTILIKPNYINSRHPSTGITTDSRVIEGVVKYFKQSGLDEIIIGEGCGLSNTFRAYKTAGVDQVAKRWGVELVDLNKDTFVEVAPTVPLSLSRVKIAKKALSSAIVSVPKLKLHGSAGVTLSIKNMMGVMSPKGSMHRGNLSKNIADLASLVKPSLSLVDGIIGGEGNETSGNPVVMNLVIAGKDPVAVDAVGAAVMGVPPRSVKHLVYSEQKGLGTYNLREIKVIGEPIEKVRRVFKRSPF